MLKLHETVDGKLDTIWKSRKTDAGKWACAALIGLLEGAMDAVVINGSIIGVTALVCKLRARR